MTQRIRRLMALVLTLCPLLTVFPASPVSAAEPQEGNPSAPAKNISGKSLVAASNGFQSVSFLFDGNTQKSYYSAATASLTLEHEEGIGSLYILYQDLYGAYTITDNTSGAVVTVGEKGFLHEFIDLVALFGNAPTSVTIDYANGSSRMIELYAFTAGEVPSFVQKWELPAENKTDLVLFSSHGDDDQLYFAGLLPYYTQVRGYQVQVVYLTDHRNNSGVRVHEMLNGLWAVGVTAYPVFGPFLDFPYTYRANGNIVYAYGIFRYQGTEKTDIVEFCTEQIRRFNPQVIVAHDFNGEYGHGQHMVYAECVAEALEISNDATQYPASAESYGLWDVPKAYFHLYEENPIVMDWDTPYEELDGLTPFQVTQKYGFPCHETQQMNVFIKWLYGEFREITRATQIAKFSPCQFGLYRTTVGNDSGINDMFENIVSYADQERLAQEEAARLEAERLAQEEADRREAERLAQEEAAQKEAERLAAELVEKAEAERLAAAQQKQQRIRFAIAAVALVLLVALAGIAIMQVIKKDKTRRKNKFLKK